jgi:CHAT domain
MTSNDSYRAALSIELEEPNRVKCRFLSPSHSTQAVCAQSSLDPRSIAICEEYHQHLEFMPEAGHPSQSWLSAHEDKRRLATEALMGIGMPEPVADQLHQLRNQIGDEMLLLELSTNSPYLDCLPWELLGSQEAGSRYSSSLVVWRYVKSRRQQSWPENRLLLASASPPEQRISPNVDAEFRDIQIQLERSNRKDVRIEQLLHSSAPEFIARLVGTRPNLLHIAMHGDRNSMYFEHEAPRTQAQSGSSLIDRITGQRELPYEHLVPYIVDVNAVLTTVMSICYSSNRDKDGVPFARKLIEAGIPSAIGMACAITPIASEAFSRALYHGLYRGKPIADAYGSAIVALRGIASYHQCLWSVPMLYGSDNVIPLPTSDYMRFLDKVRQSVKWIEELRRNLARLSVQAGALPGSWSVDSTRTAMGLGKVQTGLRYLRDNSITTRTDSYLWRLEFNAAYQEFEHKLTAVRAYMAELNDATGPASFSRSNQRFISAAPRLISELDNIRNLVLDEFPAISDAVSA